MINKNSFDIHKLKGKLGKIRDWMKSHHIPPTVIIFCTGNYFHNMVSYQGDTQSQAGQLIPV